MKKVIVGGIGAASVLLAMYIASKLRSTSEYEPKHAKSETSEADMGNDFDEYWIRVYCADE